MQIDARGEAEETLSLWFTAFFISSRGEYTIFPHSFCGKYYFCKDQREEKFTFRRGMRK